MPPAQDQGFQTEAVVKWFNLTKGFGFVAPVDGSSDAFIHSSVVNRAGLRDVAEGTKLLVVINDGMKGRQVQSIVQVLGVGEVPQAAPRAAATGPEVEMTGVVKWFKPDKGFGFVTPDDGGRDVFVHRSVVLRAGAQALDPGQKVRMMVQTAAKGREASSIDLVD
ncbi:MAG: cold shock domain-containing protein [Alphaproteobacteria bacterium]|nr:cold shock domain-containing protein [Alphaproteobacteria bacterium]